MSREGGGERNGEWEEEEEGDNDDEARLDRSREGNKLEDTASPTCFHLTLINWVKLVRRKRGVTKEKIV